jgi:ferrous iron transport protein B
MSKKTITIALAGNPNSGKTTIFNNLTGARQHVGNYPGVTVERKEGRVIYKGYDIKVIDLPGTYSLTAYSPDEVVARNVIIEEKPDVVVNILDASNLERNLYLTTQLKELEVPLVLALNMMDIAEKNGINIQHNLLSQLLGVPMVTLIGTKNQGTIELLDMALESVQGRINMTPKTVKYRHEVEEELAILQGMLADSQVLNVQVAAGNDSSYAGNPTYPLRWLAVKLLEYDQEIVRKVNSWAGGEKILAVVDKSRDRIREMLHDDPELVVVDGRYGFIRGACREAFFGTKQNIILNCHVRK